MSKYLTSNLFPQEDILPDPSFWNHFNLFSGGIIEPKLSTKYYNTDYEQENQALVPSQKFFQWMQEIDTKDMLESCIRLEPLWKILRHLNFNFRYLSFPLPPPTWNNAFSFFRASFCANQPSNQDGIITNGARASPNISPERSCRLKEAKIEAQYKYIHTCWSQNW